MKFIGVTIGMTLVLAALIALAVGGYFALGYVSELLGILDEQPRVIVLVASGVVLIAAFMIAQAVTARSKASISAQAEKAGIYFEIMGLCDERERSAASEGLRARGRTQAELERDLALVGGGRVISTYLKVRRLRESEDPSGENRAALLRTLVTHMRRDLGAAGVADNLDDVLELVVGSSTASAPDTVEGT